MKEIAALFLKLGALGFGGPAAHIAMMEDEVVTRRGWLSQQRFLDLLGATNLIPGPNSTEMAIHLGYLRGGWRGLLTAGVCFILPAVAITSAIAFSYVKYGSLPEMTPILDGIKPVVIAIIAAALLRLAKTAVTDWRLAMIGIAVAAVSLRQGHEILALLGGGLAGMLWLRTRGVGSAPAWAAVASFASTSAAAASTTALSVAAAGVKSAPLMAIPLWQLGLFFLKVGAVLYGGGYVLFAFLEGGLVDDLHLLTRGSSSTRSPSASFTPGPVLSTATFVGYVIAGPLGAIVATVGIFLPSFFFVAAVNPIIPRLRESAWVASFLDAINVSAVGLMVAVTFELGRSTLVDSFSWWMAVMTLIGIRGIGLGPVGSSWPVASPAGSSGLEQTPAADDTTDRTSRQVVTAGRTVLAAEVDDLQVQFVPGFPGKQPLQILFRLYHVPARRQTQRWARRWICVSTGNDGTPNAWATTTWAVL